MRASYGDDLVWKNLEFRNHLELVKEEGLGRKDSNPARSLGLSTDPAEGAGDTTGRARFEDSASEEGTTGRTRVRTSCPVQEPRGVSLEAGYSTDLYVPASAEEQQNYRTGEAVHRVQPAEEPIESAARRTPV